MATEFNRGDDDLTVKGAHYGRGFIGTAFAALCRVRAKTR